MTHDYYNSETGGEHFRVPQAGTPNLPAVSHTPYSLNVLLGIGVLGALLISIWIFGGFTTNMQTRLLTHPKGFDFRLFSAMSLLFQGKMIALVSIAFGAGIVWFLKKESNTGHLTRADIFIRRQFWLIILGIVNAIIFLWTEDFLFHLGIMGILLFPFFRMSPRGLLIASLVTTLLFSAKYYWNYSDDRKSHNKYLAVVAVEKKIKQDSISQAGKKDTVIQSKNAAIKSDTLTKKQKEDKSAWEGIVKSKKYDSTKDQGTFKAMRAYEFPKLYDHLLPMVQAREAQWTYRLGVWDLSSMIFLGMALLGLGFFSGRLTSMQYFLLAIAAITVGLLLGWYRFYFQIEALRDYEKFIMKHSLPYNFFFPFEQALIALGYASATMAFIKAGILKTIFHALASVGKMAITNYLFQSIVCTLFFTGFGMGYFGRLRQHHLYLLVLEIWLVQVAFSVLWSRRFREGPVEWLWRCLTYKKIFPIKRIEEPASSSPSPIAS